METPHDMTSLSEEMNNMRKKGFTEDFEFRNDKFVAKGKEFSPDELTVVQVFRFEGISDPAYMEVLYAIESKSGVKGLFVDAFGAYGAQDARKIGEYIQHMNINEMHSKE